MLDYTSDQLAAAGIDNDWLRRTAHEAAEAAQTKLAADAATRTAERAAQVSEPNRVHALHILQHEQGLTELDAYRRLEQEPQTLLDLQPAIERRRATLENVRSAQARTAFEQSPEGRQLAAAEALTEQRRRETQLEGALALIRNDPEAHGITPAMVDDLSSDQAVRLAGLVQTPDTSNDLDANRDRANGGSE